MEYSITLNKEVKINDGHVLMINTRWALTAISQTQFWKYFDITKCYDGSIKSVISVDVSDWHTKVPIELKITKKATKAVATEHLTSVLDYDKILEANEETSAPDYIKKCAGMYPQRNYR